MVKKMKIKNNFFIFLIVCVYPFLPYYFNFMGISATNFMSIILIGLFILSNYRKQIYINKNLLTFIFVISCLLRSFSMIINGSLESLFFILKILIPFIFFISLINSKEIFLNIIEKIVYVSGIICIFGIIEEITGFNIFSLLNNTGTTLNYNALRFSLMRIISFTGQAITYGIYMTFCMCFCFYLIQINRKLNKKNFIFYVIYILEWINVLLTVSRSSILCCILSQVILLFFSGFKKAFKTLFFIFIIACCVLVISYFYIPEVRIVFKSFLYMILGVFDSKYATQISGAFGNDNLNATGHRLSLYGWVFQSMNGKWLFGNGYEAQFKHLIGGTTDGWFWTITKNSIEVESLFLLFHYGIVGMVPQYLLYIFILIVGISKRKNKCVWETKLTFNKILIAIMSTYLFYFLTNCMGSEEIFFYIILSLAIAYNFKLVCVE